MTDPQPAGPALTRHHLARAARFSPKEIRQAMADVKGFNAKVALAVTHAVGSMACAWIFCLIALTSLPAILVQAGAVPTGDVPAFLQKPGLILIVAWVAQTFIQLVLLSVIMVGQAVQSSAADQRSTDTWRDTEFIKDQVNEHTDGGLKAVMDRLDRIDAALAGHPAGA